MSITQWPVTIPVAFPDPLAEGSLVYGSGTPYALSELPIGTAGQVVRSNGTTPAYSTATYPDTFVAGAIPYATATNVLGSLSPIGASGTILQSTGSAPAWSAASYPSTAIAGDVLYASAANAWSTLAAPLAAGRYLRSGVGAAPSWSALTLPNNATTGDLLAASGTDTIGNIAAVAAGRVLRAAGVGALPAWSAATYPDTFTAGDVPYASGSNALGALAIGTVGKLLRSTGTAPAWTTATFPDTVAAGAIPYGTSSNVYGPLAIAASNSVLTSSGTLPQWSATLPYASLPSAGGTWNYGAANILILAGLLQGNSHVAFGNTPDTTIGLRLNLSTSFTSAAQTGIFCDPIFQSAATTTGRSILARVRTAAAAFTCTDAAALYVQNASLGAGSAVTNLCGLDIAAISGGTNNYSLRTGSTQSLFGGAVIIDGALDHNGSTLGVFSGTPTTKQTVSGSRGGNAALASLLTALAAYGLMTDSTSA